MQQELIYDLDLIIDQYNLRVENVQLIKEADCIIFTLITEMDFAVNLSFFPDLKETTQLDWNEWIRLSNGKGGIDYKDFTVEISLKKLLITFFEKYDSIHNHPPAGENVINMHWQLNYYQQDNSRDGQG